MSDDTTKSGGQDRQRINVNQDYELRDWAKSLNTTPERVKEAVQAVGAAEAGAAGDLLHPHAHPGSPLHTPAAAPCTGWRPSFVRS